MKRTILRLITTIITPVIIVLVSYKPVMSIHTYTEPIPVAIHADPIQKALMVDVVAGSSARLLHTAIFITRRGQ